MARDPPAEPRRSRSKWIKLISLKVQALLWVVAAALTVHYTDFVNVCLYDPRVHRYACANPAVPGAVRK